MTTQLSLFGEAKVEVKQPEPRTRVQVGIRVAQVPLRKRRREALGRLMEVLGQLEGKDVYISTYGGAHNHFWLNNLKLGRLKVDKLLLLKEKFGMLPVWLPEEDSNCLGHHRSPLYSFTTLAV